MPLIIHSYNSYLLYTQNVPGTVPSSRARPVNQADHETNQATRPQGAGGQPLKGLGDPEWQGALREVWRREGPLTPSSLAGHTGLIPTLFPPLKPNEPTPSNLSLFPVNGQVLRQGGNLHLTPSRLAINYDE